MQIHLKLIGVMAVFIYCSFQCSMAFADYETAKALLKNKKYKQGFEACLDDAQNGEKKCQNYIGWSYYHGHAYNLGRGIPRDYKEAAKWYRLSADQGFVKAQRHLGYSYWDGRGVAQSYKEAVKWFRLAAGQGDKYAQRNLGHFYEEGQGVVQSYEESVKWYRLAAEQGDKLAQNSLAEAYADGRGVAQSIEEAVKWVRLAADQGWSEAQVNLGVLYEKGRGVTQSDEEALKWYRLAADQGDGSARQYVEELSNKIVANQGHARAHKKLESLPNANCTAEQFKKMVEAGLNISQISKICGNGDTSSPSTIPSREIVRRLMEKKQCGSGKISGAVENFKYSEFAIIKTGNRQYNYLPMQVRIKGSCLHTGGLVKMPSPKYIKFDYDIYYIRLSGDDYGNLKLRSCSPYDN